MADRRSYGSGSLKALPDAQGRETYYGIWRSGGRQVKRRLGVKRTPGNPDGLTVSAAEKELRRQMALAVPSRAIGARVTVQDAGARYVLDAKRRGRKASTLANIESEVRIHLEPFFGDRSLDAIEPRDIDDLIAMLEGKELAAKSIRNIVATLSALFNFARAPSRGWASENPCVGITLPATVPTTEIRFLTLEEVDAMIRHVPEGLFETLDRVLLSAAPLTGLRKGELVALRWMDVDWPAQRIRVERSYTRGEFTSPKSGRSRSVPMIDELGGKLDGLFQWSRWQGDRDLVFAHPAHGGVIGKSNVRRRMKAALRAAGLDDTHRFHDLRHTYATRLAAQGYPMRSLQELLGHADLKTTERYSHYAPASRDAEMIAAAFDRHGHIRGHILSESESTSEHPSPGNTGSSS